MRSPGADRVLLEVQRRLRRQDRAAAFRFAAWLTAAIGGVAVLLHLYVRPVHITEVLPALAMPWLLATLQTAMTRTSPSATAAWADRNLDGLSAYATYVENLLVSGRPPTRVAEASVDQLIHWLEETAPRGLARLTAAPLDAGLRKPVAVALVAALLAIALLQIPGHPRSLAPAIASQTSANEARPEAMRLEPAVRAARQEPRAEAQAESQASADDAARSAHPTSAATREDAGPDAERSMAGPPHSVPAKSSPQAASGGREAGSSPDAADDNGPSLAWQGEMATRMRELAAIDSDATRADSMQQAEYSAQTTPGRAVVEGTLPAPAAASPPPARDTTRLDPAAQAYVRAYFAAAGATR